MKDKLENKLHDLICSGQLPVEQAQQEIAQDWIAAYQKHVGPLPEGVQTPTTASSAIANKPDEAGNCPLSSPIKVSKNGIYHSLGDPNYKRTKAKNYFPTPEAAQAAGFRAPKH